MQFNSQLYSGAKQNYEYQGHESQPDHGLRRIMMGARCINATVGRMDGVDNYASAAPGWSSYRFAFNNPVMYTDPHGNFESSQYNSSTPVEIPGGTFNNGFRKVSFRAAGFGGKSRLNDSGSSCMDTPSLDGITTSYYRYHSTNFLYIKGRIGDTRRKEWIH